MDGWADGRTDGRIDRPSYREDASKKEKMLTSSHEVEMEKCSSIFCRDINKNNNPIDLKNNKQKKKEEKDFSQSLIRGKFDWFMI